MWYSGHILECKVYVKNKRKCPQYHAVRLNNTVRGFEYVQVLELAHLIEFVQVQYGPATRSQQHWQSKLGGEFAAGRESRLWTFGDLHEVFMLLCFRGICVHCCVCSHL